MAREYYSDRVGTPRARTEETISKRVWDAIAVEVHSGVENGAFGVSFPLTCDDAPVPIGCRRGASLAAYRRAAEIYPRAS